MIGQKLKRGRRSFNDMQVPSKALCCQRMADLGIAALALIEQYCGKYEIAERFRVSDP